MKTFYALAFSFIALNLAAASPNRVFVLDRQVTFFNESKNTICFNHNKTPNSIDLPAKEDISVQSSKCAIILSKGNIIISSIDGDSAVTIMKDAYLATIATDLNTILLENRREIGRYLLILPELMFDPSKNRDSLIEYFNTLKKLEENSELKISENEIEFSSNAEKCVVSLKDNLCQSINIYTPKDAKKLSIISIERDAKDPAIPSKIVSEVFCPNGELAAKIVSTIKLKKEISDEEAAKLFDTYDLGKFKFVDLRISNSYEYDNGIPTIEEAKFLPTVEVKTIVKIDEIASENKSAPKSAYVERIKDFVRSLE